MNEMRERMLRSALYVPGSNDRALEKARDLPADALVFDLEDSVAPDAKAQARERVCAAAASGAYGERMLAIRINSIGSEWHQPDLIAVAAAAPGAVVVPKVGSAQQVLDVQHALEHA